MKKKSVQKKNSPSSRVERYTVGSGLTKEPRISFDMGAPLSAGETKELHDFFEHLGDVATFEGRIRFAEAWAVRVLKDAGLPVDPGAWYAIPEGTPVNPAIVKNNFGCLRSLIEARGGKELEDKEWYAAKILSEVNLLRKILDRVKNNPEAARKEADALTKFSFELGLLVYEAIGFKFPYERPALRGFAHDKGSRSRKPPRRSLALERYIAFRRRDSDLSFEAFCDELSSRDDADPAVHDETEIWCENNRVMVDDGGNKPKSYSFRTLERYWKAPPTRSK